MQALFYFEKWQQIDQPPKQPWQPYVDRMESKNI